MVTIFPRSCGLNHHDRQTDTLPPPWDPGLTGNYSSACLITMKIDFLQLAKSAQTAAAYPLKTGAHEWHFCLLPEALGSLEQQLGQTSG